ncbi:hypothetical protein B7P43_G03493, partial [Cryptotermes secundus]
STLNEFNTIHHKFKFKMEQQSQNKLNYLDLSITTNNELKFEIYRKPTSTDLILHNTSCHPYEHKAAINYLRNRINTYVEHIESFYIYELTKQNLQMNQALTNSYNPIYDKSKIRCKKYNISQNHLPISTEHHPYPTGPHHH